MSRFLPSLIDKGMNVLQYYIGGGCAGQNQANGQVANGNGNNTMNR